MSASRLLFIADLHLSAQTPALLTRFQELLERERGRCAALYILGDLFDAWIGDDDPSPFADEVRKLLRAFSRRSELAFQRGNRDFMVSDRFAEETGAKLLDDEHLLHLKDRRVLLLHGDQLCTDDHDYQAVRSQVRSPAFRQRMMMLDLEERARLAAEFRRRSGETLMTKPSDIMDVNAEAVAAMMEKHGADLMIHGHTHRPAIHDFRLASGHPARRVVLPDWRPQETRLGFLIDDGRQEWIRLPAA
jgi:UDP-2,3-diacylglucosamine hydrolase